MKAQCNATITPLGPTTFCQGDSVKLVGSLGNSYQWYLNGTAISGANNDTLNVLMAGSYEVEIDSNGCIDTSVAEVVIVKAVPAQPGMISGPDPVCTRTLSTFSVAAVPGATAYYWQGICQTLYGAADTTLVPSITGYPFPGQNHTQNGFVAVKALNGCGMSQYISKPISVYGAPKIGGHWPYDRDVADIGTKICPGLNYTLFPVLHASEYGYTAPYTYQWCLNGIDIPGETQWQHIITQGGNYSVKIITQACGTFTIGKLVHQDVPNSITISPAGPLSYCVGNATPLTVSFDMTGVTDPIKWVWLKGSYYNQDTSNTLSILPDTSGYYTVWSKWAYPSNCNVHSNSVLVTIPPGLDVTQLNDTLFATPGYSSYQWSENNVPIPGATSQRYELTYDGIYSVEATFSNGCVETSDTFDSDFMPPPPEINEEEGGGDISIYPNPVTDNFTITAKVPLEDLTANITITDMMGRVIFARTVDVKNGIMKEKIETKENISRLAIVKVRSKGSNLTTTLLKK